MDLSIVVPAYNEAARIAPLLDQLSTYIAASNRSVEVIVVDDGSTDATSHVVSAFEPLTSVLRLVRYEQNQGKGRAVAVGMLHASGAYRAFLDADGATPASEIDNLIRVLDARPRSVAIGSLRVPGAEIKRHQPLVRNLAGRVGNAIIRAAVLPGIADSQRGAKLFPAELADRVFADLRTHGWGFDIEVLARCRAVGYSVIEVPVQWHHVDGGRVQASSYLKTLREVGRIRSSLRSEGISSSAVRAQPRAAAGLMPLERHA